jgi:putative flippase GtrA
MYGTAVLAAGEAGPATLALRRGALFVLVGALSVALDVGLLAVLHGALKAPLLAAASIAFWLSLAANFGLNRSVVFAGSNRGLGHDAARYLVLAGVNYLVTLAVVGGLVAAGMPYLLAKLSAVALIAASNFVSYRHWVFAGDGAGDTA